MRRVLSLSLLIATLFVPLFLNAASPVQGRLSVMSYNIRYGTAKDGTNSWDFRYPASAMMIHDQKPDVVGLQEALEFQVLYLDDYVEGYKAIGVGRDNGKKKGEYMAILYNTETVSLVKWGTFWLSETPKKPSMGWDAACFRTATWALMKDRRSGEKFFMVNTHLDHVGVEARRNGLALILTKLDELNPQGYPTVVTGDFNITPDAAELENFRKEMKDTREIAFDTDHEGTFNGWGKSEKIIDYIWCKGFGSCTQYETVKKAYMDRTFISDHYPIKATLVF
ncbi:MAG: endonuclease/exonuclease/phosphatase family protein [Bacteroidales bacterium]|nr:endonuclease/exonuclease/phosphatase family protein [Bacteroidales bacterium]